MPDTRAAAPARAGDYSAAPTSYVLAGRAFANGGDSPSGYLERCLERLAAAEPQVGAFVDYDLAGAREQALAATRRHQAGQALSLVDGMPIGVKDIIETRDFPTRMGSEFFSGWHARRDAACVHTLRMAGAIIVGKTTTTEFAVGRAAKTRNPRDIGRTPAGSSSGSAAAVAAGMLPLALGSQTQSSTLRPAAFCGVVGYKPTHGLLDMRGVHPLAPSHDHLGLLSGTLDDAWAAAEVIAGSHRPLPGADEPRRLGFVHTAGWEVLDAGVARAFEQWLECLADAGVVVETRETSASIAALERELADADDVSEDILAWEMQWPFASYLSHRPELLGDRLHDLVARGRRLGPDRYRERVERRESMRACARAAGREVDAFVSLAASGIAPLGLVNTGERSFPIPWSLIGGPSISLPLLEHDGLPLGVQIMAPHAADRALFACARSLAGPDFASSRSPPHPHLENSP